MNHVAAAAVVLGILISSAPAATVPDHFPRFVVPGHEEEMQSLRRLFWLHYEPARPLIPLWDEWMSKSTLWPARADAEIDLMRSRWATMLASRGMNDEGYIHTDQHDGLAHAQGWPFPLWTQGGGMGWHFRGTGIQGYDAPPATTDGWNVTGGSGGEINDKGWPIDLAEPRAVVQSPAIALEAKLSPWLRLNWWAKRLDRADCYIEWTTQAQPQFSRERRAYFPPAAGEKETRTMIRVHHLPGWSGTITGLRIGFDNPAGVSAVVKSFHTAFDTRHNINNSNFIRGAIEYFLWSRDLTFLREQMPRIRKAMRFMEHEFQTREKKCIYTTWPGHEGRSGVRWIDGKKQIVFGEGVGSNYWDLLPFGGEDALASVYYYDTLLDLAELEEQIAAHPQWNIPAGAEAYDPVDLREHAQEVKAYGTSRFWNEKTGRFGTVDLDGKLHDYGFTFLNTEAIYFGFATDAQAKSIRDWIDGRRTVDGDTSTGADIYHWRFGPRSTTLRNIDYYFWAWSAPESIPWGYQVQDGGAVLGFSYHDLMSILKVDGPDTARLRLRGILDWFDETQAEGGYRAYYAKDPARGTMQGGNVPGGLGLDKEFFESILVPQVMLYGFMGFRPTADGFRIAPRLPGNWPELTITRIHLHQHVLDITARRDGSIAITGAGPKDDVLTIHAAPGTKLSAGEGLSVKVLKTSDSEQ